MNPPNLSKTADLGLFPGFMLLRFRAGLIPRPTDFTVAYHDSREVVVNTFMFPPWQNSVLLFRPTGEPPRFVLLSPRQLKDVQANAGAAGLSVEVTKRGFMTRAVDYGPGPRPQIALARARWMTLSAVAAMLIALAGLALLVTGHLIGIGLLTGGILGAVATVLTLSGRAFRAK
jgi:hypothetical protein